MAEGVATLTSFNTQMDAFQAAVVTYHKGSIYGTKGR
jgi:hypothetical protein